MTEKLTNWIRDTITTKFLHYTFGTRNELLLIEEGRLAREIYNTIFSKTDRDAMSKLPKGWLPVNSGIAVNAGGYSLHFTFYRTPLVRKIRPYYGTEYETEELAFTYQKHNHRNDLKRNTGVNDLIDQVQKHANAKNQLDEDRSHFRRKMQSFLKPITTAKKFKELMPEWETILGKDFFGTPVAPVTALTTTASEIMCQVASGRGEKRDGCCDGKVIAL